MKPEIPKPRKRIKVSAWLLMYAMLATYPAYVQTSEWTNAALDAFAAKRMGITVSAAKDYNCVMDAMDGHPATKMGEK